MKRYLLAAFVVLAASCSGGDWHDASLPVEKRVKLLLKEMTLEEKIGQMCQYVGPCYVPPDQGSPYKNIDASDENLGDPDMADRVREGKVGSFMHVLTGEEAHQLQLLASESRLAIPLLFGIDAIHGNGLRAGCTVYPSNINLASTFRPEIMEEIGAQTAIEMRKTAMVWTFSPNLDVARDARWGRMGETFGEDPWLVSQMGKYMIWGLQGRDRNYSEGKVMACAKHLIAGGEPFGGLNAANGFTRTIVLHLLKNQLHQFLKLRTFGPIPPTAADALWAPPVHASRATTVLSTDATTFFIIYLPETLCCRWRSSRRSGGRRRGRR